MNLAERARHAGLVRWSLGLVTAAFMSLGAFCFSRAK